MDVFATKDGKIYKVSLKNFVAATDKKSPYYKRVKQGDDYIEKAYAICPGCGNPVHFVNLFNRGRKKKAHVRHQRSSIRNLAKYSAAAYKGCPYVTKDPASSHDEMVGNVQISDFCTVAVDALGFSWGNAELLARVYFELLNDNQETAAQRFFAMMASACYSDVSASDVIGQKDASTVKKYATGFAWGAIGKIPNAEVAIADMCSFGFEETDVRLLFDAIREQHADLVYAGKPDFAHLCATVATILNEDPIAKTLGGSLASVYDGIGSADASAGYIGDLCGTDGVGSSMNDSDYKADLDAVNLASRIKDAPNASLLNVVSTYYGDLDKGAANRAEEFKRNVGMQTLNDQRDAYLLAVRKDLYGYNEKEGVFLGGDDAAKDKLAEERLGAFNAFIDCIEKGVEDWPDE